MLSISIIVGLVAMLSWGIADFLQSTAIRKLGEYKTMFLSNFFGFLALIPFLFNKNMYAIAMPNLLLLFFAGFSQVVAIVNFYKSMNIGEIAIVTPISASYPVVAVILMVVFLHAKLTFLSVIAIIILIIGIILTATDLRKLKHLHEAKGVKESLFALVLWGFYFFVISLGASDTTLFGINFPETHYMAMFFYSTIINGAMMATYALMNKGFPKKEDFKSKKWVIVIITTIIYTIAWIVLNYGMTVGNPALITSISSLYPMICVVLAMIFNKEKLVINQKIGIATILLGLVLISL